MIRYYAYYSCGGYKDMYLGNSLITSDYTYFLPLLPVWRKGGKPEYAAKVELADSLNLIEIVSQTHSFGFPTEAQRLFSHGGYRMIYCTLKNGNTCLAIRDITNGSKDEENRDIPFTIIIIATEDDVPRLDAFAIQALGNPNEAYQNLSTAFAYNPNVNGITFALQRMNSDIESAPRLQDEIVHVPGMVSFMLLDSFHIKDTALKELNLTSRQVELFADMFGHIQGVISYKSSLPKTKAVVPECKDLPNDNEPDSAEEPTQSHDENADIETTEGNEESNSSFKSVAREILANISDKFDTLMADLKNTKSELENIRQDIKNADRSMSDTAIGLSNRIDALTRNVSQMDDQFQHSDNEQSNPDKITINNPTLFFSGISLIVGFLLGALIF